MVKIPVSNSMYYPTTTTSDNGSRDHNIGVLSGHPTVNQIKPNRYVYPSKGGTMRSTLLEEFRNSKNNKKFELKVCLKIIWLILEGYHGPFRGI